MKKYKCPQCNAVFEGQLDACPNCGKKFKWNTQTTAQKVEPTKKVEPASMSKVESEKKPSSSVPSVKKDVYESKVIQNNEFGANKQEIARIKSLKNTLNTLQIISSVLTVASILVVLFVSLLIGLVLLGVMIVVSIVIAILNIRLHTREAAMVKKSLKSENGDGIDNRVADQSTNKLLRVLLPSISFALVVIGIIVLVFLPLFNVGGLGGNAIDAVKLVFADVESVSGGDIFLVFFCLFGPTVFALVWGIGFFAMGLSTPTPSSKMYFKKNCDTRRAFVNTNCVSYILFTIVVGGLTVALPIIFLNVFASKFVPGATIGIGLIIYFVAIGLALVLNFIATFPIIKYASRVLYKE